ncbi:hypothetical protein MIMGU_mgv1a016763mg [Erythranthe guttata]|uniref:Uncharacterized protein n=1 Tax=Erythranthe guttata TaxID=4155 RepID=A0A022R7J6_ERYGU|nr:hypothetical protein MIMGU_mgv1a016763mg [Erythranthe guttata]
MTKLPLHYKIPNLFNPSVSTLVESIQSDSPIRRFRYPQPALNPGGNITFSNLGPKFLFEACRTVSFLKHKPFPAAAGFSVVAHSQSSGVSGVKTPPHPIYENTLDRIA